VSLISDELATQLSMRETSKLLYQRYRSRTTVFSSQQNIKKIWSTGFPGAELGAATWQSTITCVASLFDTRKALYFQLGGPMKGAMIGGRSLRRVLFWTAAPTSAVLSAVAYSTRPVYFDEPSTIVKNERGDLVPNSIVQEAFTNKSFLKTGLYGPKTDDDSIIHKVTQGAAIFMVTALSRVFMEILNDTKIVGNLDHYNRFMQLVYAGNDRKRGMITVSNHTSVFDDPVLQSTIVRFIHPDKMRWGICKESICFSNPAVASFTGAGKVVPIKVGAGLEQFAFKGFARRLADGDWVHIYPEAACIQSGSLGRYQLVGTRKEESAKKIGLLKWGVGKLAGRIAFGEDDLPPIIIPYYHVGMDKIKPQKNLPGDNGLADPWYIPGRVGHQVRVFFGPPIVIDDIIAEFEKKTGRKRRLARVQRDSDAFTDWEGSTKEEQELYSKITKRVEEALVKLEDEVKIASSKRS
jgi:monolysocardiolipin acyltransferase